MHAIKNPGLLADFIALNILVRPEDRQAVLEIYEPLKRLEKTAVLLESEAKLLKCEMAIHKKVREQIDNGQRDYYLREQLKVIQNELGMDGDEEVDEYYEKIEKAELSDEIREKLNKEVVRLSKTPYGSPEAAVIRNYIDICLEIPWSAKTEDRLDVKEAREILDRDHDGLDKVKERHLRISCGKAAQSRAQESDNMSCRSSPVSERPSLGESIAVR